MPEGHSRAESGRGILMDRMDRPGIAGAVMDGMDRPGVPGLSWRKAVHHVHHNKNWQSRGESNPYWQDENLLS